MLTRKQRDLLHFIHTRLQRDGVPPSFDEMKDALDLRSKSGIHRLITALEERGFIRRLAHRARAIEILRLPDPLQATPGMPGTPSTPDPLQATAGTAGTPGAPAVAAPGFTPAVIEGSRPPRDDTGRARPPQALPVEAAAMELPVMGRIAAGTPIEAISEVSHHVAVPGSMLGGNAEHFALEVRGDSMIEAGINDGDIVVIRMQPTAENGDIVVALVEEQEATLKRFRRRGGMIALEAANPAYETRLLRGDQVRIQGRLVGLIRSY